MKHGKSRIKAAGIICSAIGGLCLAAAVWAWPMLQGYAPEASSDIHSTVRIPAGATESQISDSLTASLGSGYSRAVVRAWKLMRGNAATAHGLYEIKAGTPAWKFARRLSTGRQTPVRLTFNNIRTLEDLASRVGARMEFGRDDFLSACDSVLPEFGFSRREQYPAAFLPDTYEFFWTADAGSVVKKLASIRGDFWNEHRREQARQLGLRPVDVATVASIAEEETASTEERPVVARLYLNRLHKGMKLQADPTVKFATGDFSLRRITGKHLGINSPYNTYRVEGLPPGPIRIPERSTLDAVLNAPEHPYLYMCARPDFSGRHNFAVDYATHEKNAAAYRRELNARGIR